MEREVDMEMESVGFYRIEGRLGGGRFGEGM